MTRSKGLFQQTCNKCNAEFQAKTNMARYCDDCRWRMRGRKAKYIHTTATDAVIQKRYAGFPRGRSERAAKELGWPKWVVCKRAIFLGLANPASGRKEWTHEEVAFILMHTRARLASWIAKKLGRSHASVVLKIRRLGIGSRKVTEGYTVRALEASFGCDHHKITQWVEKGWLKKITRGFNGARDAWQISELAILEFITEHPEAFELRKVEPTWFMELIGEGLRQAVYLAKKEGRVA